MGKQTSSPLNFTSETSLNNSNQSVKGYGNVVDNNSTNLKSLFGRSKFTPYASSGNDNGVAVANKYQSYYNDPDLQDTSVPNESSDC